MSYFGDIYKGIKTLLTGMGVTGKVFLNNKNNSITQQYPDNRETLKMLTMKKMNILVLVVRNVKLLVQMVLLKLFGTDKLTLKLGKRKK